MENVIKLIIILHSSAGYSFVIEDIKQWFGQNAMIVLLNTIIFIVFKYLV